MYLDFFDNKKETHIVSFTWFTTHIIDYVKEQLQILEDGVENLVSVVDFCQSRTISKLVIIYGTAHFMLCLT